MKSNVIYKRLADVREDLDFNQGEIAKKLGVTKNMYSKWEREVEIMPLKRLNEFCNITKVNMDYVAGLTTNKKATKEVKELSKKEIGKRIRQIRKKNNLTQKDLADLFNTSQSVISAYENGQVLILSAFAFSLVKKYRVSLDWLCTRSKEYDLK